MAERSGCVRASRSDRLLPAAGGGARLGWRGKALGFCVTNVTRFGTLRGMTMPTLTDVEALIDNGDFEAAQAKLDSITPADQDRAEVAYFRGLILERTDRWAESRYALPVNRMTLGEALLSLYSLITVIVALAKGNHYAVPFLLLYLGGFGYVAALGLHWPVQWTKARGNKSPRLENKVPFGAES